MCAPPRFCTQLWALQRYFCLFVILNGLESTTLKPIYWFWASGENMGVMKTPALQMMQMQKRGILVCNIKQGKRETVQEKS